MGSESSDAAAGSQSWLSLAPHEPFHAVEAAARLDDVAMRSAARRLDPGPLMWALEEAADIRRSIESEYANLAELPTREIGVAAETWLIDIVAALMDRDASSLFVPAMSELGRVTARIEVPFEPVIRSMRRTQQDCLLLLLGTRPSTETSTEEGMRVLAAVARTTDDGIGRFVADYLAERSALISTDAERQRELITDLLADPPLMTHATATAVATKLGLNIHAVHTAFVIDHRRHPDLTSTMLNRALRTRVGEATLVFHPESPTRTSFWLTTTDLPGPEAIDPILETLQSPGVIGAAMGQPETGPSGFRRTYLQAHDLVALAPRLTGNTSILRWADYALTLTLGSDLERSRWFVRSVLGPLAHPTEKAREQRATLRAYLATGNSLVHAAEERNVHRNTIVYRLERIEQLTGRSLRGNVLDIQCALHLVDLFGDDVLEHGRVPPYER